MKQRHDRNPPRLARGFTLIELMVALGMALAVTTSAVTVMVLAVRTQHEGTARNELTRDAQLVIDTLGRDLAYVGAGVPRGFEAFQNGILKVIGETTSNATSAQFAAQASQQLRPAVRIGDDTYLAFIGDAPYPNAELNGILSISGFKDNNSSHKISLSSELSPCGVSTGGGFTCDTTTASLIEEVGGATCTDGAEDEPTCPWGLNKWQDTGTIALVLGGIDGTWYRRAWSGAAGRFGSGATDRMFLHLEHMDNAHGTDVNIKLFQNNGMGGGYVTHLDRVFYSLEDQASPGTECTAPPCTLWRRQCWGWDADNSNPGDSDFPSVGAAAIRSTASPADCTAPNDGTPWEPVMEGVESLELRYYAADNLATALSTPLNAAAASRARVLEVRLHLKREVPGSNPTRFFEHRMQRRFWLENAGGLVTAPSSTPLANGGCNNISAVTNECNPQ